MQEKQDKTLLRIAAFFWAALPWAIYLAFRTKTTDANLTWFSGGELIISYAVAFVLMFLFGKFVLNKYFPKEGKQTSFDIKIFFLSKIIARR